jgi:Flp pilus assembly protein TadG
MNASPFRTWKRLRPVRRARGNRGVALIETAIVLVVLTMIMLGIMQFGYVFYVHHSMVHAARDAARAGSVRNGSTGAAMSVAHDRLSGFPHAFDVQIQIPEDGKTMNRDVRVSITAPIHGMSFGLLGGGDLRAQATVRRESSGV